MTSKVKSLTIYPLKSAQGIELKEMEIDSLGPRYDREWMVVDTQQRFVTQRVEPRLSMIKTEIKNSSLILSVDERFIHNFPFPTYPPLEIPLIPNSPSPIEVKVFEKTCSALHLNKVFDEWISELFQKKLHFVQTPPLSLRTTSGRHGPVKPLRFPDGYPFLLVNNETVNELSEKQGQSVNVKRFRPNILIEKVKAGEEENWIDFKIDGIPFTAVKKCTRCIIVDIDPEVGFKNNPVIPTLRTYRKIQNEIIFGINLVHHKNGVIRTGSALEF